MNLDHLYYFKALVEAKSRTVAADRLAITPSTLSLAISKLERELGVTLIEKKRGSVELTTDGVAFYEYVATALRFLDGGVNILQERHGGGCSKRNHHRDRVFGPRQGLVAHRVSLSAAHPWFGAHKRQAVHDACLVA